MTEFTTEKKLYSLKTVSIATVLGGPLAAGYLIRKNFKNLGKEEYAKTTIFVTLFYSLGLIGTIFLIPDGNEKIANFFFPLLTTGIATFLVNRFQKEQLEEHKRKNLRFYSGWNAAGIGLISASIFVISFLGIVFVSVPQDDSNTEEFQFAMTKFSENETMALKDLNTATKLFDLPQIEYLLNSSNEKWQENLKLIDNIEIENLPIELKNKNELIREYYILRIHQLDLFKEFYKDIENEEIKFKLENSHNEIVQLIEKLQQ